MHFLFADFMQHFWLRRQSGGLAKFLGQNKQSCVQRQRQKKQTAKSKAEAGNNKQH